MNTGDGKRPLLNLDPIGVIRTGHASKVEAPRQPGTGTVDEARIELFAGRNFEHALEDLADWDMIWVLFWFHLNQGWRPKVLPPRSATGRKGVFATRAPHRPNPIGLSAVRLLGIEGLTLSIAGADMVDGTPVLDIKPYVPYTDAYPTVGSGWLERQAADPVSPYAVVFEMRAAEQADWISAHTGFAIRERIVAALAAGPQPHPYRRIRRDGDAFRIAVTDWRARFSVSAREIRVIAIASGYRPAEIAAAGNPGSLAVHRAYRAAWGE